MRVSVAYLWRQPGGLAGFQNGEVPVLTSLRFESRLPRTTTGAVHAPGSGEVAGNTLFARRSLMRNRVRGSMIGVAAAAGLAVIFLSVTRSAGQAQRLARIDGHPNFSGIWQALNEANWDLEAHAARAGMMIQKGV